MQSLLGFFGRRFGRIYEGDGSDRRVNSDRRAGLTETSRRTNPERFGERCQRFVERGKR
jgi:hypothetical protein